MIKYFFTLAFICMFTFSSQAQVRNSVSLGGGIAYPPFEDIYKAGWYSSLHWNVGVGKSSLIDTHLSLIKIGVKDYPVGPGTGNTDALYQLGVGFRQYFTRQLFARAGLAASLIDQGEQTIKLTPNAGIGYDLFVTEKQSVELSLQSDFFKNNRYFNSSKYISVFSLGVAYKFWY
ncbi:MAG: hypothetical protein V4520_19050 [Bacteroidota bacterium]